MKIGIDFHGVIDTYPDIFAALSLKWIKKGYEVHILTGKEWGLIESKIKKFGISYTHHFSIVDHHLALGTLMEKRINGWWMQEEEWNKSKGDYAAKEQITLHFDNDLKYIQWFPETCSVVLVRKNYFQDFYEALTGV